MVKIPLFPENITYDNWTYIYLVLTYILKFQEAQVRLKENKAIHKATIR